MFNGEAFISAADKSGNFLISSVKQIPLAEKMIYRARGGKSAEIKGDGRAAASQRGLEAAPGPRPITCGGQTPAIAGPAF